jgi:hypothetical protein
MSGEIWSRRGAQGIVGLICSEVSFLCHPVYDFDLTFMDNIPKPKQRGALIALT